MSADRDRGELALLLHGHMPYVEGFGTWPFGEEWLFEAIATVYLPLIDLCEHWAERGESAVLTLNVSPVLADQLALPAVGKRYLGFVREVRSETHRIDIEGLEGAGDRAAADVLRGSAIRYERAADRFEELGGDLLAALRRLGEAGAIELWTSAATHAVLPLLATETGLRLQVRSGIDSHRERLGSWTGGFWLPECAYRRDLEEPLSHAGVQAFCVYRPDGGESPPLAPIATGAGPAAIPIDWETIALVWDEHGYPADPLYRDYHAPTLNGMRPYANGGGAYVADAALARVGEHADDFLRRVGDRLDAYRSAGGRPGLLVCALDAELLGHWWHEGPAWLDAVVSRAGDAGIALATLPAALARHEPRPAPLAESSWGDGKDLTTWDSRQVAELLWPARQAELALAVEAQRRRKAGSGAGSRAALGRAARELLALQSSDWAFMATRKLAADYPERRISAHAAAFEHALSAAPATPNGDRATGPVDAGMRGLAPRLALDALLEPPSAWGRTPFEPV